VSVGFTVERMEKVEEVHDIPVYRATAWTPVKISLFTLAFDVVRGLDLNTTAGEAGGGGVGRRGEGAACERRLLRAAAIVSIVPGELAIWCVDAGVNERLAELGGGHLLKLGHDPRMHLGVRVRQKLEGRTAPVCAVAHDSLIVGRNTPRMQAELRTAVWMWLSWRIPEPSKAGSPSEKPQRTVSYFRPFWEVRSGSSRRTRGPTTRQRGGMQDFAGRNPWSAW
jgi:hypothetical protein